MTRSAFAPRAVTWLAVAGVSIGATLLAGCADASDPTPSSAGPETTASSQAAAPSHPDGVSPVTCDLTEQTRLESDAVAVLADPVWRVGGWSHVNGVGSFATVAQPVSAYRITAQNWLPDDTCAGAKTFTTVLAKKTYDWNQQHANGMEASFPTEGVTFADVTDVVLVLRFDPERSHLPDAAELTASYGDLLTPEQLASLDAGEINLELTLFGEGAGQGQPFMNAGTIVAVNPAVAADGWVRVQIPREQLTFYTEDNYVRTEVDSDAWGELLVQGLRINPETASGLTARHFLQESFDVTAKPELFKEMALTFALIEVGRR